MAQSVRDDALALQRLYSWEKLAPDRVVLTQPVGGGKVADLAWRRVVSESRRMAAHLQDLGLPDGARVAILSKNTAHWLMSDFAIWLAGFVSVPLYPTLAPRTIRQVLEHSGSSLLFVGKLDGWARMKAGVPPGLPCISHPLAPRDASESYPRWDEIVSRTAPLQGEPSRRGDDLATIIYTSGTTGTPKGVMHSFAAFAAAAEMGLKRMPIDAGTRVLSHLPLAHVVERVLVEHGLLATGMHVYFSESLDTFATDLQRARPTVFITVPRLWLKFQQAVLARIPAGVLDVLLEIPVLNGVVRRRIVASLGLDRCRYAAGGAAPMPPDLLRWYARLGVNLAEGYGMTENCAVTHITSPAAPRPGTVGRPYDGVSCRIDPGTDEIQVRSPAMMLGYYRDPALTRSVFTDDGWLRTGDRGTLDAEGNLAITGRVKDPFKTSKGKYVVPAPIEDELAMHTALETCCVTGAGLAQPIALVTLTAEARETASDPRRRRALEQSLLEHLGRVNEALDPHERLDRIVVMADPWTVDNDLVTPTFKVRRHRAEEVFAASYAAWAAAKERIVWQHA